MKAAPRTAWQRTRRLAFLTAVVMGALAVLLPLAAPMLEAVVALGMPLSYYVGSQSIPIAVVIAVLVHLIAQRRIDRMSNDDRPEA